MLAASILVLSGLSWLEEDLLNLVQALFIGHQVTRALQYLVGYPVFISGFVLAICVLVLSVEV